MSELGILLGAVFTAFGGLLVGFYRYQTGREKIIAQERKEQTEIFTKTLEKLGNHIQANTTAHRAVATATQQAAQEAEKRNGHLADLAMENKASNDKHFAAMLATIADMKEQHVGTQHVDKQTVVNETVKHKG